MKKIAIVTLTGNINYGNRLQNYALQEAIKKDGYDVKTLWNIDKKGGIFCFIKEIIKIFLNYFRFHKLSKRKLSFFYFGKKYIKRTLLPVFTGSNLNYLNEKYDKFVIGSDQIWNCEFNKNCFGEFEFANFADENKCVSYAASFGISEIPEKYKKKYIKGLNGIKKISVRESRGSEIVKELTGKAAKVVLDPTMLLTKKDWEKMIEIPREKEEEDFLLTYFLGGMSLEARKFIEEYAKKRRLKIIELCNENNKYYYYNPGEFLYLLNHAQIVLTDSFHACVFSILFQKPFYVLERRDCGFSMNSRLDTLLNRYNLSEKKINEASDMGKIEVYKYKNYQDIEEQIEKDREESLNFLKEALEDD